MKFKSKIDWWFHLVGILTFLMGLWVLGISISDGSLAGRIIGVFLLLTDLLLILPIWINTNYTLEQKSLVVKCGLGRPLEIPYEKITAVEESISAIASSALSRDRLAVNFLKDRSPESIFVSPNDKAEFAKQLNGKRQ